MSQELRCNFCGEKLSKKEFNREIGKWDVRNLDGTKHEYKPCKAKQLENQQGQQQQIRQQYSKSDTINGTGAVGISINSVYIKTKNVEDEVKSLRKQLDVQATIIDSMAQNITLLLKKVGYPEPEPVIVEASIPKQRGDPNYIKLGEPSESKPEPRLINDYFICHGCEGSFHDGYEIMGAKLCRSCKDA